MQNIPNKILLVPQEKELTGNGGGSGLKGLLVASAINTGNLIVTEIGNGRYVNGEQINPIDNFEYTDGSSVTTLSWSVNASASKGDVIIQGDLYDRYLETGNTGQVLKSLGTNGGIYWDTLPTTTGTVTKVDAGTGMVSNPSTGIINTGDVAINYTGANNAILSATAGNIESTDTIWFSAADSGNIEKGLVSDLISKVTGYTAGTGLLLNGNVFSIDIPLSVANGGTNLTDISTLENVNIDFASDGTGVLPISHGGSNNSSIAINSIFHSGPTSNLGTGEYTIIETTDANNNYVLTSNGAGAAPSWKLAPSSNVSIGTSGVSTGLDDAIISETSLTGSVLITSNAYNGGNSVGHVPSGGTNALVYLDGTGNWSVPAGSGGGGGGGAVDSVVTTNGSYIDLTPTTAATGAVTITADLSTTGTKDSSTFLRSDNTWATPAGSMSGTYLDIPLFTQNASPSQVLGVSAMRQDALTTTGGPKYMAIDGCYNTKPWDDNESGVLKIWAPPLTPTYEDTSVLSLYQGNAYSAEGSVTEATFIAFFSNASSVTSSGATNGRIKAMSPTTVGFAQGSDYRLKQNIKDYKEGLHNISNLRPVTYQMKSHPEHTVRGFIAHEVQEYIPSAVHGVKDGIDENGKAIIQDFCREELITDMVSTIKQLKDEVDSLKAEIKSLK